MNTKQILKKLTLEEKIALCSGKNMWQTKSIDRFGIASIFMCDGPHGLRKQENIGDMLGINASVPATCFPAEVSVAASWNPSLIKEVAKAIAKEAKDQNVSLVLGPGANIKRNPLCGRNFEYYSEDPYLTGKLAAAFIQGIEEEKVGSSLKHFACNSQEKARFISDSVVDERTLKEIYLTGFEIAVKEGKPSTVMCAYNKVNGIHCSGNKMLLTNILRDEWKYEGLVITDWGAMENRIESFQAGCDLCMPGGSAFMEKEVKKAIEEGSLDSDFIDRSCLRVLNLVTKKRQYFNCDYSYHHELAKEMALQGAVLLKNEDHILPIQKDTKIALIGDMAKHMRYQGAGSSHIHPTKISEPIQCFSNYLYAQGVDAYGICHESLLEQAKSVAKDAEISIIFAGLPASYESEGYDRDSMKLPEGYLTLIQEVSKVNANTVVVLFSGSVVECDFEDSVKAILYMGLPGQAGGQAVADLIYGKRNPEGKLAETWPFVYEDVCTSSIYGKGKDALYQEGIYVGYRYYDKANVKVRYPFGYGLSYTEFSYSNLRRSGNLIFVTVENVGNVAGSEVVQLYIQMPQNEIHRPIREMKRFQKLYLEPKERKEICFEIDDRCFSIWQNGWVVPSGEYRICIDQLSLSIEKEGEEVEIDTWQKGSWYETCQGELSKEDFEKALGYTYKPKLIEKGKFTLENTIEEMKDHSHLMHLFYKGAEKVIAKGLKTEVDYNNPEFKMMMSASAGGPLRSMKISSGIKGGLFDGLVQIANGHFFKGVKKILKG